MSTADDALAYAEDVISGRIPACGLVKLAVTRFMVDLGEAEVGRGEWEFKADLANEAMSFCEQMPNVKGPLAGQAIRLMPWQAFMVANVFGFVERGTQTRRFRQAVIYVPRGNGKTSMVAPLALYTTFGEGEGGAEGYAAAVTRDQARILFDTAREMVRRSGDLKKVLRRREPDQHDLPDPHSQQVRANLLGCEGPGRPECSDCGL